MLRYKSDFLRHYHGCRRWAEAVGAEVSIDFRSLDLHVRTASGPLRLQAQFVGRKPQVGMYYTPQINPDIVGFVGWLPYFNRTWSLASSKLEFKAHAAAHGVPTPTWGADPSAMTTPFIVKKAQSSFGHGIRGPYRAGDAAAVNALEPGEYCEALVLGKILRAWYWNERLAVLECFEMPKLEGDGKADIATLLRRCLGRDDRPPEDLDRVLAVQGLTQDTVLAPGQKCYADYRYVSPLNPTIWANFNVRTELEGTPIHDTMSDAGQIFWRGIPPEIRADTAFVLDAVADENDNVYLLEMNSNAQGHPDFYETMLPSLQETTPVIAQEVPPPAPGTPPRSEPIGPAVISSRTADGPIAAVTRIATEADRDAVNTLRRMAYAQQLGFSMNTTSALDWNEDDDVGAVIVVCDRGGRPISSMRLTALGDQEATERFFQYSMDGAPQAYPTLAMSRSSTLPEFGTNGLQGLIRHAYLSAIPGCGLRTVSAIVYDSAPRVNSMRNVGFVLTRCKRHWDSEAQVHAEALVATLDEALFESARAANMQAFGDVIGQCEFDVDGIRSAVARIARRVQEG
jgi:hypothetical protein